MSHFDRISYPGFIPLWSEFWILKIHQMLACGCVHCWVFEFLFYLGIGDCAIIYGFEECYSMESSAWFFVKTNSRYHLEEDTHIECIL